MPFTFSHPAIILPFSYRGKKYFSITALVIGSIVPDFEYFIRMHDESHYSHTWKGVLWFDLPLAVASCFLFHQVVRNRLISNLPQELYKRFAINREFNWKAHFKKNWSVVIISVIIGTISHLVWDRFTHKSFYFVSKAPGFGQYVFLKHHPKLVYRVFQTLYSIIGLGLLAFAIWQLPKDNAFQQERTSGGYWTAIGVLAGVIYLVTIISRQPMALQDYIGPAISSFLIALIVISLILPRQDNAVPGT